MMRAIVVSRLMDTARRRRIEDTIPKTLDWSILDATDGHDPASIPACYARLISATFWGNPRLKPGAIGCFISHYRIWEMCAAAADPILVLEDDAIFNASGPDPLEVLSGTEADIVFLNRRTVRWAELYANRKGRPPDPVADLGEVVSDIVEAQLIPRHPNAAGTDCYIVTPAGARALMALAENCGTVIGLDWFMVGATLLGKRLDGPWETPRRAAAFLPAVPPIPMGVAGDWLVETREVGVGASVIAHGNTTDSQAYLASIAVCTPPA